MPIIKSAIKRARQNTVRRSRRQPYKTHMKTMMRKMVDLTNEGKKDEAAKLLPSVYKTIDTAAKKNIIHPKNAARKKSRMAKLIAK
ncbi:30S ribosomal protein S20 [Candidatus Peregrinibacteria bacterium]|jgi:small subunit ribosomal protein S20|nr:30S ribosomal protein S20 [Candidatus Peregrinibacteria bacterium]MBT3598258.1 30S ribosomal protein S20 [Candidatus Peregrinibacteria bacterium]MBT4366845.1 30S ribosomal protein S20 [Candidatus Peregrinibacteria bacterium]MBT4585526.1 30S ribosomal protein S20 [Candidatus Peregrinibacteria bacterium]MBT6731341.1 30S ribosomal protein S20 [Candidatus Peregrinibacteria bacterium]